MRHICQIDQQYELAWNFPKKSAAKSNAERAWQTTVNKDRQWYETKDLAPTIMIGMLILPFYQWNKGKALSL